MSHTDRQLGWIEAMIDFEGALSLRRYKLHDSRFGFGFKPELDIGNTDRSLLEMAALILGIPDSKIRLDAPPPVGKPWKRCWRIRMGSNALRELLPKIQLVGKEDRRLLLLEALRLLRARTGGRRWHAKGQTGGYRSLEKIWKQMKRLNERGLPVAAQALGEQVPTE